MHKVTLIIPTTAEARRRDSLLAAIKSGLSQVGVETTVLLVLNGDRYCPELRQSLLKRNDIKLITLREGNLPAALNAGRDAVTTPFFCFLDDDDCYLPDTLIKRVNVLAEDPTIDVVVSNGYRRNGPSVSKFMMSLLPCQNDPLGSCLENNWLASCGGTYRTERITADYFFDNLIKYREWTYLAILLAIRCKIVFIDDLTFEINSSENSLSKSEDYRIASLASLKQMKTLPIGHANRRLIQVKFVNALHDLADYYLQMGDMAEAVKYHLKSLFSPGGLRYLLYTRKLILKMSGYASAKRT